MFKKVCACMWSSLTVCVIFFQKSLKKNIYKFAADFKPELGLLHDVTFWTMVSGKESNIVNKEIASLRAMGLCPSTPTDITVAGELCI